MNENMGRGIEGNRIPILHSITGSIDPSRNCLFLMDVEKMLDDLPEEPTFNLIVTSPPYNIGKNYKDYDDRLLLNDYIEWQRRIIQKCVVRLKDGGSICWQVGNYIEDGCVFPLDIELAPIFKELGLKMRNRIVWHFGHGLHSKRRFSGRYEVILWYTKGDNYTFNLDAVRVPAKYPGKRSFKGKNKGQLSGNPLGKNPEDVWEIPNVKGNHVEKTEHPCQFPVGLIERLVLALTSENELVFDPFAGASSTGVAALLHNRRFWGCDIVEDYLSISQKRLEDTLDGTVKYRPFDKPIYDAHSSNLSKIPEEWEDTYGNGSI